MSRAKTRYIGEHTMVSLCPWTAHSISQNRPCYKQQFYGIPSHRCIQMSPWVVNCEHNCIHCWRPPKRQEIIDEILEPCELIDEVIKEHLFLVAGFKGNPISDKIKAIEARKPTNVAMSLTGEAWMYPHIDDLIGMFKERGFSVILVTAGKAYKLFNLNNLPSMLYTSIIAYDAISYKKYCRPKYCDWNDFLFFCKEFRYMQTVRLIRFTLIRDINNHEKACNGFAKIIRYSQPDFIEIRSFIPVARAMSLGRNRMLTMDEILDFCLRLCKLINYKIQDRNEDSNVILLGKKVGHRDRAVELLPTPA